MSVDAFQAELSKLRQLNRFPVDFRAAPIAELLSSRIEQLDIATGAATMTFVADERFVHGGGVVQGGIIATMMDFCIAVILLAGIEPGESIGTTNLNVEYHRPALPGTFRAHGRVTKKGRTISFAQCELYDMAGKQVAAAGATNMLIQMDK